MEPLSHDFKLDVQFFDQNSSFKYYKKKKNVAFKNNFMFLKS